MKNLEQLEEIVDTISAEKFEALPRLLPNETLTEFEPFTVEEVVSIINYSDKTNYAVDLLNVKLLIDGALLSSFPAFAKYFLNMSF